MDFKNTFFMVLCLAVNISCSPPAIDKQAPFENQVQAHKKFRVNLPEDHNTGYTWHLKDDFDPVVVEELNAVWHGNVKGIDFNFMAGAAGQTTLTFIKRKYDDTAGIKTFVVNIFPK